MTTATTGAFGRVAVSWGVAGEDSTQGFPGPTSRRCREGDVAVSALSIRSADARLEDDPTGHTADQIGGHFHVRTSAQSHARDLSPLPQPLPSGRAARARARARPPLFSVPARSLARTSCHHLREDRRQHDDLQEVKELLRRGDVAEEHVARRLRVCVMRSSPKRHDTQKT